MNAEQYLNELPDSFRGMLDRLAHSPRDARVPEWLRRAFEWWEAEFEPSTKPVWRARELLVFADLIAAHDLVSDFVAASCLHRLHDVPEVWDRLLKLKFVQS